ncbi:MAG: VOC family protein [Rhodospirillaceae bacterium]|nr:VOC family protein [Rhodospirillaceae bacterium]
MNTNHSNRKHGVSLITLGITDVARSRKFYAEGFGWVPVFEMDDITFYQMNGFVFGTWLVKELEGDMQVPNLATHHSSVSGAFALAHNVDSKEDVQPQLDRLVAAGGKLLRAADAPPHGGFRGYAADPDGHAWEIAWNPWWPISADGHVTFKLP